MTSKPSTSWASRRDRSRARGSARYGRAPRVEAFETRLLLSGANLAASTTPGLPYVAAAEVRLEDLHPRLAWMTSSTEVLLQRPAEKSNAWRARELPEVAFTFGSAGIPDDPAVPITPPAGSKRSMLLEGSVVPGGPMDVYRITLRTPRARIELRPADPQGNPPDHLWVVDAVGKVIGQWKLDGLGDTLALEVQNRSNLSTTFYLGIGSPSRSQAQGFDSTRIEEYQLILQAQGPPITPDPPISAGMGGDSFPPSTPTPSPPIIVSPAPPDGGLSSSDWIGEGSPPPDSTDDGSDLAPSTGGLPTPPETSPVDHYSPTIEGPPTQDLPARVVDTTAGGFGPYLDGSLVLRDAEAPQELDLAELDEPGNAPDISVGTREDLLASEAQALPALQDHATALGRTVGPAASAIELAVVGPPTPTDAALEHLVDGTGNLASLMTALDLEAIIALLPEEVLAPPLEPAVPAQAGTADLALAAGISNPALVADIQIAPDAGASSEAPRPRRPFLHLGAGMGVVLAVALLLPELTPLVEFVRERGRRPIPRVIRSLNALDDAFRPETP